MHRFTGRVISGSGRGRTIGSPTFNIDLADVPEMQEGIYAAWVRMENDWEQAAIHYGPRPVFHDSTAFEIHVLHRTIDNAPQTIEVAIAGYLRPITDFPSVDALRRQIAADLDATHAMLSEHGAPNAEEASS